MIRLITLITGCGESKIANGWLFCCYCKMTVITRKTLEMQLQMDFAFPYKIWQTCYKHGKENGSTNMWFAIAFGLCLNICVHKLKTQLQIQFAIPFEYCPEYHSIWFSAWVNSPNETESLTISDLFATVINLQITSFDSKQPIENTRHNCWNIISENDSPINIYSISDKNVSITIGIFYWSAALFQYKNV